ncbi:MAG: ABC transporter substrate-binding protein [Deltaproteobacteria bacterium]|nr:ABC transporter substrate-binding protein [Deltaproteobacteria bacterium]
MKRYVVLLAIIVLVLVGTYLGKNALSKSGISKHASGEHGCSRIVSLAPSITETLFALGLGDKVVGRTRFDKYPPEVSEIQEVGGYYDPNYESIVALRPDLVIILVEHEDPEKYLTALGMNLIKVSNQTIDGIMEAIGIIGNACGKREGAELMVASLQRRMKAIREKTADLSRPQVMISIGRNMGSDEFQELYIAGQDGFYDEMLRIAGGLNAYQGRVKYPTVSNESVLKLDPEVIIDVVTHPGRLEGMEEKVMATWERFLGRTGMGKRRVYVLAQDFMVIPGPRFIDTIEELARVVHPEVDWERE